MTGGEPYPQSKWRLALHSCLGGSPAGFHVTYLRDRHFKISISCKQVGLLIHSLKRITTSHFDVYFHLWREGGAEWRREMAKWLEEEERSWTKVVSRHQARKKKSHLPKKVCFIEKLVQVSPKVKSRPIETQRVIKIGSIFCDIPHTNSASSSSIPAHEVVDPTAMHQADKEFHRAEDRREKHNGHFTGQSEIRIQKVFQNLKQYFREVQQRKKNNHRQLAHNASGNEQANQCIGGSRLFCSKCLGNGHGLSACSNSIRCWFCFNYGHKAKFCFKKRVAGKLQWAMKHRIEDWPPKEPA